MPAGLTFPPEQDKKSPGVPKAARQYPRGVAREYQQMQQWESEEARLALAHGVNPPPGCSDAGEDGVPLQPLALCTRLSPPSFLPNSIPLSHFRVDMVQQSLAFFE